MIVEVWICPQCENYYASSAAGDLSNSWNTDAKGNRTFRRSQCPSCQTPRVIHRVEVTVRRPDASVYGSAA